MAGMTETEHKWFAVGDRFSKTHTFTPAQVRAFSTEAGDSNPLHHDDAAAAASRYGRLIASGTHTTALVLGLTAAHFSRTHSVVGVSFSVEFRRPVFADATVRIEWEVVGTAMRGARAQRLELRGAMVDAEGALCVAAQGVVQVGVAA